MSAIIDDRAERGTPQHGARSKSQKPQVEAVLNTAYRAGRIARRDREALVAKGLPMRNPRLDPVGRLWCKEFIRRMHAGQEEQAAWWRGWNDGPMPRRRR